MPDAARAPIALRVAGGGAVLGGAAWALRGAAALLGRQESGPLFEFAPAAMAVTVVALVVALGRGAGAPAVAAAVAAAAASLASSVALLLAGEHWVFNVLLLLATLTVVVALYVVGRAVARAGLLGPRSALPRRIGAWTPVALLIGGLLGAWNARLVEAPMLVVGMAWMLLGAVCLVVGRGLPRARAWIARAGHTARPGRGRPPRAATAGGRGRTDG